MAAKREIKEDGNARMQKEAGWKRQRNEPIIFPGMSILWG